MRRISQKSAKCLDFSIYLEYNKNVSCHKDSVIGSECKDAPKSIHVQ